MARSCTVCVHPERHAIDAARVARAVEGAKPGDSNMLEWADGPGEAPSGGGQTPNARQAEALASLAKEDAALVAGESTGKLSGRYRTIDERALRRHRANHLPTALAKAHEAEEVSRADDLLSHVQGRRPARVLRLLEDLEGLSPGFARGEGGTR